MLSAKFMVFLAVSEITELSSDARVRIRAMDDQRQQHEGCRNTAPA